MASAKTKKKAATPKTSKIPQKKLKEMTPFEIIQDNLKKQDSQSQLRYGAEFDYESSGCRGICHDDYCRCSVIQNAKIISVNADTIINYIIKGCSDLVLCYCVDRLFRISPLADKDNWEVNIEQGYYGEETHGVQPTSPKFITDLLYDIAQLEKLTPAEQIKMVLQKEYGYLIPAIKQCQDAEIKTIHPDLVVMNNEYMRKLDQSKVNQYLEHNLPLGVYTQLGKEYRLIDGFHRLSAAQQNAKKSIEIIVLK